MALDANKRIVRMKIRILGLFLALMFSQPDMYCLAFVQEPVRNDILQRLRQLNGAQGNNPITKSLQPSQTPLKSKQFYQEMLEDFCKANYNRRFRHRSYVYGSLRVEGLRSLSENIVEVWGTHSYKGRANVFSYNERDFKATIHSVETNKYHIKFEKKSEYPIGGSFWESTDVPFTYNP